MRRPLSCLFAVLTAHAAARAAQDGSLDVLDGETLYDGGWLATLSYGFDWRGHLREGERHVRDPLNQERFDHSATLALHFGLRHDLQLSAIVPYVGKELTLDDPAGPDSFGVDGPGDIALLAKWRFFRWDAPRQALNLAAIAGLELPTGLYKECDHGRRLEPELQPGSGSWDPIAGLAATYEPARWRFNAVASYQHAGQNSDDQRLGDEFFAELAAGNRFWLEPYPGPFMRLDGLLRFYWEDAAREDGHRQRGSASRRVTLGANLAFRPRPSLDFQVRLETPVYEHVDGRQLGHDLDVELTVGLRF